MDRFYGFDLGDAESAIARLEKNGAGDAVVIIGFAPYSQEAVRVAHAAHTRGCRVVAICDSKLAPVAQHATITLVFPTETPNFFPTSAPAMVLIEALAGQLLSRAGRSAIDALGRAEDDLRSVGAYLDAGPPEDAE